MLLHSCGNIDAILEDLADMGIDAINNIQVRAGMDLASTKKRIGDRVTIVGNVDATEMCIRDRDRRAWRISSQKLNQKLLKKECRLSDANKYRKTGYTISE